MTTSKGTIQGFNGLGTADKKHQIVIDAQVFGSGSEQHTLKPIVEAIRARYNRLGISDDIYADSATIVTADTGFSSEENNQYLKTNGINAYIPDNQFRSRDPKFKHQKEKYGKRHQNEKKKPMYYPSDDFKLDSENKTCHCPVGEVMWLKNEKQDKYGNDKLYFEGPMSKCRQCKVKSQCMRNPLSAEGNKGQGRQVSFITKIREPKANYTDWMKARVDSDEGKQIYSHRMSVIEPVFGNIGTNKRLNKFSVRGKVKVQDQWRLYCLIHNIQKLANYGQLAS